MKRSLGELEQLVLLGLVRLGEDAYGVPLRREILERTGRDVSLGAIYKTLERIEAKGFVSTRLGPRTPERGGRRKKLYRLSASGVRALRSSLEATRRMVEGLDESWRTP